LGRRDTPDSVPDPAPEQQPTADASPEEHSSGALDDAAPETVQPDPQEEAEAMPVQTATSAPEAARPLLRPVPDLDEPDTESEPQVDAEPAATSEIESEVEPETESDSGVESAAQAEVDTEPESAAAPISAASPLLPPAADPEEIFVPERPRRELLTLERPAAPEPGDQPGEDADDALDIAGSPRASLRMAGVAVPKMHQLVRRNGTCMWAFGVRASEALHWWLEVRQVADQTGWMPVLLGAAEDWRDSGEGIVHEGDDELTRSEGINATELLHDKAAEAGEPSRGVPILPRRGDSDFATPRRDGLLGLVQTDEGWKIPAMFPWAGSTNWELYGAEHAAILRDWARRFDAEIVAMTYDVLELYVPHPPGDEDALKVAGEAYAYCPDLLDSGVPTLEDLAEHMIKSKAWYFRWT
jgi:hypothetical protein